MEERREAPIIRVEDAMRSASVPPLDAGARVNAALALASESHTDILLVKNGLSWAEVSRDKLAQCDGQGTVGDIASGPVPHVHPDHPLEIALRRIGDWPLLPVVHRADPQSLIGILSLSDILRCYSGGPARSLEEGVRPRPV
jgi:CBS domain-containing protein